MEGGGVWRQQLGSSIDHTNRSDGRLQSLSSMLDSAQPTASLFAVRMLTSNGELESESELIALGEDLALLFSCGCARKSRVGVPIDGTGNQTSSCGALLTDLFPTGFTSSTSPPSPRAAATVKQRGGEANTAFVGGEEPELDGRQAWTCVAPSTSAAPDSVASTPREKRTSDGEEGSARQSISTNTKAQLLEKSSLHQRSWASSAQQVERCELDLHRHGSDSDGKKSAQALNSEPRNVASPATIVAAGGILLGSDEPDAPNDHADSEGAAANPMITTQKREDELKHALDRLVPRLLQSEERVKFLEAGLQQARRAESGRNGLIKQALAVQEEANHLRHRLETRHAEALDWREKKRSLEDDNARLGAELHDALGRNTCLQTENRRKDSLLAEARVTADAWAERKLTLEVELRHKTQLLSEAEREKKRAWQTTNASAETAKVAMMRAEAAAKEASDLRNSRRDHNRQDAISSVDTAVSTSGGERRNVRGVSLADAVAAAAAAAAAASAADGGGGPDATRRGWLPAEADHVLTSEDGGRGRARSMSPDRGRSKEHTTLSLTNPLDFDLHSKVERNLSGGSHEGHSDEGRGASSIHPPMVAAANDTAGAIVVDEGKLMSRAWRKSIEEPPFPKKERGAAPARTTTPPGTGRRTCTVFETPPPVARSAGRDGDKQRHDSDGVRSALTGASPAWTDTPSSTGAWSPKATTVSDDRRHGAHRGRSLRDSTSDDVDGVVLAKNSRVSEDGQNGGRDCKDYGRDHNTLAGRVVGDARIRREERAGGVVEALLVDPPSLEADASSAAPKSWDPQAMSPRACQAAAAGQTRGRDSMSSRRSSLSGAGVGVAAVTNGGKSTSRIDPGNQSEECRRPSIDDVHTSKNAHDDGDSHVQEMVGDQAAKPSESSPDGAGVYSAGAAPAGGASRRAPSESARTKEFGTGRRQSAGLGSPARSSTVSLASLLERNDSPGAPKTDGRARRESRRSAPFATDEVEDELRPVREVERRLMLLQMEMSQLEAEQNKLVPKASKTMRARVQIRELDTRIAALANESSKLRRVLREKSWRL